MLCKLVVLWRVALFDIRTTAHPDYVFLFDRTELQSKLFLHRHQHWQAFRLNRRIRLRTGCRLLHQLSAFSQERNLGFQVLKDKENVPTAFIDVILWEIFEGNSAQVGSAQVGSLFYSLYQRVFNCVVFFFVFEQNCVEY